MTSTLHPVAPTHTLYTVESGLRDRPIGHKIGSMKTGCL